MNCIYWTTLFTAWYLRAHTVERGFGNMCYGILLNASLKSAGLWLWGKARRRKSNHKYWGGWHCQLGKKTAHRETLVCNYNQLEWHAILCGSDRMCMGQKVTPPRWLCYKTHDNMRLEEKHIWNAYSKIGFKAYSKLISYKMGRCCTLKDKLYRGTLT